MYKLKHFYAKIVKILKYLPVLWQDEDWDYYYLLMLLKHKINNIGVTIRDNNIIKDADKVFSSTQEVIKAIDTYVNSNDIFIELYASDDKYCGIPNNVSFGFVKDGECLNKLEQRYKGEPLNEAQQDIMAQYYKDMYNFERKNWDRIWDLLKQDAETWWD